MQMSSKTVDVMRQLTMGYCECFMHLRNTLTYNYLPS